MCALVIVGLLLGPVARVRAAEAYGSISGQVTEASSHVPAQGVEVCAFSTNIELFEEEPGESAHHEGCAKTDASGEYTISGLDPESY